MEQWQISTILSLTNPIVLLALCGTVGVVLWTFITMDPGSSWKTRFGLPGFRLLICLCAVYMLMQPSLIVTRSASSPTPLALVFDTSASMGFPVEHSRLSVAVARARQALRENDSERKFDLQFFGFAKSVRTFEDLDSVVLSETETEATSYRAMMSHLSKLDEERAYAGILLFSDGADTSNISDADVQRAGIPLNVSFVGSDSRHKDLVIKHIDVDEFAFSRKPNPIQVTLENHGLPLTEMKVNLLADGKILQQKTATVIDGLGQVTFNVVPGKPGRHIYQIVIPQHPEEDLTENNTRFVELNVMRDKYRILHLSGVPNWDQRFLRDTLTNWPQVDLVSFYLLRTTYQSTTQSNTGLSLIPFPTEQLFTKHLKEFDLIVFQDFEPAAVGVDAYLNAIAEYVAEGGALVLTGGASGMTSQSISRSKLGNLLPVELPTANTPPGRLLSDASFSPVLTELGRRHPIFVRSVVDSVPEEQLRSLPRLNGIVRMKRMQPNGQVLLAHSHIRDMETGAPLMAVSEPGHGRILLIATDSLWSWGFSAGMTGAPSGSKELSRMILDVDRKDESRTTPIHLNLSLLNREYLPAAGQKVDIEIAWTDDNEQVQSMKFEGLSNNAGMFRQTWTPLHSGPHSVHVTAETLGLELDDTFLVKRDNQEMIHLTPNAARLRELCEVTGGAFFEDDVQIDDLKLKAAPESRILSRTDTALWSHPLAFLLLMGLLIGEWVFRRFRGLV